MRILVEIELPGQTITDYQRNHDEWHPTGDQNKISVDNAYLEMDPTDDSFYLFRLRSILP